MDFLTTRWDLVLKSQDVASWENRNALAELCSLYWEPLCAFARHEGFELHDAEDLTQSFFLHLLEKEALQQVHPSKGRFRCFLLASFKNHISTSRKHALAAKRGGACRFVSLDADCAEDRYYFPATDNKKAEALFDAHWARLLLERVMLQVSEYYCQRGKQSVYEQLSVHLRLGTGNPGNSYEESAKALGISVGGVKTLVWRMRKKFATLLRRAVAQTVADPTDIDAELRALLEALVNAESLP
jgi:DNA-directed RNA polymerase specialized sigma24 family protein